MMDSNRDPANVAAVCYNKGYRVENQANVRGLVSAKLSQGILSTDYDCMYLQAPNAFWTDSDGGFINVSNNSSVKSIMLTIVAFLYLYQPLHI
jgi:hypothetical protein